MTEKKIKSTVPGTKMMTLILSSVSLVFEVFLLLLVMLLLNSLLSGKALIMIVSEQLAWGSWV